ncbi:unnamed protein product [Lepidochelys kempii]
MSCQKLKNRFLQSLWVFSGTEGPAAEDPVHRQKSRIPAYIYSPRHKKLPGAAFINPKWSHSPPSLFILQTSHEEPLPSSKEVFSLASQLLPTASTLSDGYQQFCQTYLL